MTSPIPITWDVPESIRVRVGHAVGRQRLIVEDEHVLVLLHAQPKADDPTRRDARLFWRRPDGTWRASAREGDSTIAPLRAHVDGFHATVEAFEDQIEQAVVAGDWFRVLHALAPFARTARNLARVMQELRERLPADREVLVLRDRASDVERAAELVHQWASQGLDFSIARANEEQARLAEVIARSGHRLNRLAALTLPLTALGALLGTNLQSGLETLAAPYLFWGFGIGMVAVGFVLWSTMPEPGEGGTPGSRAADGPEPKPARPNPSARRSG